MHSDSNVLLDRICDAFSERSASAAIGVTTPTANSASPQADQISRPQRLVKSRLWVTCVVGLLLNGICWIYEVLLMVDTCLRLLHVHVRLHGHARPQ